MQTETREGAKQSPLVSIAMPAFNCARTIIKSVSSCLEQTYRNIEVVVIDDGSVDETAARLASIDDSRLRVIRQANGGLAAARNAAMRASRGEFIAWMDADDIMVRDRVARQAEILMRRPAVVLVSSDFSAFTDEAADFDHSHIAYYYQAAENARGGVSTLYADHAERPGDDGTSVQASWGRVYPKILWGNFVHPPTVMLRRDSARAAGELDETLRNSCDYDFIVRMARLGEFAYLDAPLLRYRYAAGQLSGTRNLALIKRETVTILEKAMAADPAMYQSNRGHIDRRIALSLIGAAQVMMDEGQRVAALRLLGQSCQRYLLPKQLTKALLHAIPLQLRGRHGMEHPAG